MADPNQNSSNSFESEDSGWGDSNGYKGETAYGYDSDIAQQHYGNAGDSALNTDFITNSYVENPYESNVFDNAYSETLSNPNPTHDYGSSDSNFNFEMD